ncbi:MAG: cobalt-precorrin 5A hydrolase [Methanotrichaceae archaeon]
MLIFLRNKNEGEKICQVLSDRYLPSIILYKKGRPKEALEKLKDFDLVVAVMATGIIVRLLCKSLKDKWTDSPVVAVDSSLRCAVPVIGGHHGANDLAIYLSEKLGLFPAITTATDAAGRSSLEFTAERLGAEVVNKNSSKDVNLAFLQKDVPVVRLKGPQVVLVDNDVAVLKSRGGVVVGVGTRRGVSSREVVEAVVSALESADRTAQDIRVMATAWIKKDEEGLSEAAKMLKSEMIYLDKDVLNSQKVSTRSRASDLGLIGVAEPAALALSSRLLMPKKVYGRVTIALGE